MEPKKNRLKELLKKKNRLFGIWSSLASPLVAEMLSISDFDFAVIDMEHSPNELGDVVAQLQASSVGSVPFAVRPPWNDFVVIKRLLDAGAQSLILPYVQNGEEARAAVAATRYPPDGVRGVAGGSRASGFGRVKDYLVNAHKEICVIVQVETGTAAEQVEAIAGVKGVDAVFVGPADLSASLGHLGNAGHEEVKAVMNDVLAKVHGLGKPVITLSFNETQAQEYAEMGFDGVVVGSDSSLLMDASVSRAAAFAKYKQG